MSSSLTRFCLRSNADKGVHVQSRMDDTIEDMKMIVDSFGLMVTLNKSDCALTGSMTFGLATFVHKTFGNIMQSATFDHNFIIVITKTNVM